MMERGTNKPRARIDKNAHRHRANRRRTGRVFTCGGNLTISADEFGPRVERPALERGAGCRDLGRFHGSQKFPGFQKNFKIVENGGRGTACGRNRGVRWQQMRSTGRNSGMSYDEVLVLIPSHSLEDFPSELSESDAESILNAFSIAWDPRLLLAARSLPKWHRADDPPAHERDGSCSSRRIARAGSPEGVRAGDLGRRARGSRIVGTRERCSRRRCGGWTGRCG